MDEDNCSQEESEERVEKVAETRAPGSTYTERTEEE